MDICASVESYSIDLSAHFPRGRPKRGSMYGAKNIGGFKDAIKDIYMQGERNSSKKMNPDQMIQELQRLNPTDSTCLLVRKSAVTSANILSRAKRPLSRE